MADRFFARSPFAPAAGEERRIVRIGPDGLERAAATHHGCSTHTLWSRYHRAMGDPRTYLRALLARPGAVHRAVQDTLRPKLGRHAVREGRREVYGLVLPGDENQ
ncbi:hypothetical protein ABT124_35040 [Streptomyces sp. NPDC001982]|uniref:hypothetical protein n=1 Tax=Streptomyces sp. NPDC001982 TaxID=3154405 RepID=UPI00331FA61D